MEASMKQRDLLDVAQVSNATIYRDGKTVRIELNNGLAAWSVSLPWQAANLLGEAIMKEGADFGLVLLQMGLMGCMDEIEGIDG